MILKRMLATWVKMQIIVFGAPGVGKGTLSDLLAEKYKIPHLSTGDIFRAEIKSGNSELIEYVEKGLLVPDSVVNKVIEKGLKQEQYKNGFILDGYPRTIDQAQFLDNVLWKLNKKLDFVFNMAASDEEIVERMTQRRQCSKCGAVYNLVTMKPKKKDACDKCGAALVQRKDDEEETVRKRIEVYKGETSPVIEYYRKRKMLIDADASKRPKDIFNNVVKIIGKPEKQEKSEKAKEK